MPFALVVGLTGVVAIEPIRLQIKLHEAREILAVGKWKAADRKFSLRDSAQKVDAYLIPLGSECSAGFIVESEKSHVDFSGNLKQAYPSSPEEKWRAGVIDFLRNNYKECNSRAEILFGRKWHGQGQDICKLSPPPLKFYNASIDDARWFDMDWCGELGGGQFYCEASKDSVALASGNSF